MTLEGLNKELESSEAQDYWRGVTSDYVINFWKEKVDNNFELLSVKTNIIQQISNRRNTTFITFKQDYVLIGNVTNLPDALPLEPFSDAKDYIKILSENDRFRNLSGVQVLIRTSLRKESETVIRGSKVERTALTVLSVLLALMVTTILFVTVYYFFIRNTDEEDNAIESQVEGNTDTVYNIVPNSEVATDFTPDNSPSNAEAVEIDNGAASDEQPSAISSNSGVSVGLQLSSLGSDMAMRGEEGHEIPYVGPPIVTTGTGDFSLIVSEIDDIDYSR